MRIPVIQHTNRKADQDLCLEFFLKVFSDQLAGGVGFIFFSFSFCYSHIFIFIVLIMRFTRYQSRESSEHTRYTNVPLAFKF